MFEIGIYNSHNTLVIPISEISILDNIGYFTEICNYLRYVIFNNDNIQKIHIFLNMTKEQERLISKHGTSSSYGYDLSFFFRTIDDIYSDYIREMYELNQKEQDKKFPCFDHISFIVHYHRQNKKNESFKFSIFEDLYKWIKFKFDGSGSYSFSIGGKGQKDFYKIVKYVSILETQYLIECFSDEIRGYPKDKTVYDTKLRYVKHLPELQEASMINILTKYKIIVTTLL